MGSPAVYGARASSNTINLISGAGKIHGSGGIVWARITGRKRIFLNFNRVKSQISYNLRHYGPLACARDPITVCIWDSRLTALFRIVAAAHHVSHLMRGDGSLAAFSHPTIGTAAVPGIQVGLSKYR